MAMVTLVMSEPDKFKPGDLVEVDYDKKPPLWKRVCLVLAFKPWAPRVGVVDTVRGCVATVYVFPKD